MKPALTADLERILRELRSPDLIELLVQGIPGSDLNSLLLKVFSEKTRLSSPSDLLSRYRANRFVQPASADVLRLRKLELDVLNLAAGHHFSPVQLSPVAPLGSASVVGTVDQNKVISALRGTEVVSDATNLLALHAGDLIKSKSPKEGREEFIRLAATHRHVRAQFFGDVPGLLPHFHLFCIVTSGVDQGSYRFEKQAFAEHIRLYRHLFQSLFGADIEIVVSGRDGYKDAAGLVDRLTEHAREDVPEIAISIGEPGENQYYKGLQFTVKTVIGGKELSIGDGGLVDWTQRMLGSRKERLLISAIGLERLLL